MSREDRNMLVSASALVVVILLVVSPVGAALRAKTARDARTVNGVSASATPRPNRLVPLDPSAHLRLSTIPLGTAVRGRRGEMGPQGETGPTGDAGRDGPGRTLVFRSADRWPAATESVNTMLLAKGLDPGAYLTLSTVQLHRDPGGGEVTSGCGPSNGVFTGAAPFHEVGASDTGGQVDATAYGAGGFASAQQQDIALRCFTQVSFPRAEHYDSTLIVMPVPSIWMQLGAG